MLTRITMRTLLALALFVSISDLSFAGKTETADLIWPFEDYHSISSNFGEYRPGHVHMGIDIRVGGIIGVPALAVADGYISRIKVKPGGYGRAVYLTLTDGRTAVYAHMDSFAPEIEKYVKDIQWNTRSFKQDLYLSPDKFSFRQSEVVAYSGRSGSEHPHLHFEIRGRGNQALNPLANGLDIKDSKPPLIMGLGLIPLIGNSEIDGDCRPQDYRLINQGQGKYTLSSIPKVWGNFGIAIYARDYTDEAPNPIAPFRIVLYMDGKERFSTKFEECDYYSYLQVEIDRDPYFTRRNSGRYFRLFKNNGNDMPFYTGEGAIESGDFSPGEHHVRILVEDIYGNGAELNCQLQFLSQPTLIDNEKIDSFSSHRPEDSSGNSVLPEYNLEFMDKWLRIETENTEFPLYWLNGEELRIAFSKRGKSYVGRVKLDEASEGWNFLYSPGFGVLDKWNIGMVTPNSGGTVKAPEGDFEIAFPPGSVFDTLFAALKPVSPKNLPAGFEYAISGGYTLEPQWIPFKRTAVLNWSLNDTSSQAGIYYLDLEKGPTFLGNQRSKGKITAGCLNLEIFTVVYDRTAPEVRMIMPRPDDTAYNVRPEFKFGIEDTLSGIENDGIAVYVDGEWALAEYDPPRDAVYAEIRNDLAPGEHTVRLIVADKCGNVTDKSWKFYVK